MSAQKAPRVVAELGRPETYEETAARKAEQSRKYRANKTINNLWLSLIVCVGVVIVIVLLVPRNDSSQLASVDYRSVATSAQAALPVPLAVPDLPSNWSANAAEIRTGIDKTPAWYIGLITPVNTFLGLSQGVNGTDNWLADQVHNTIASGTTTIAGVQWTIYDNRTATRDVGNVNYALTTQSGASTYVLFGNASDGDFRTVATALAANVEAQPATAMVAK
ncbi:MULTISPECIES: DUF4245 domain-containing protein [Subtercola]|uniref:DUF4245 domain-containing protein n=1 Tax=Subtercola vilae TaxID=2056433 RepID=A0A4T2BYW0_9MICO|nr:MULTISPECIES: DUF4245 domain-containing protein [Subtercola]MEA9985738.1 DUF4245 domain-containing protein [Subtercola sp. RTI3]TIH37143.1 DUF4245 domain-containing protein [Subtercola vilae]